MAKTKACGFCGKEITTGFFKGTEQLLDIGNYSCISCCEDCYNKHEKEAERIKERLGVKLDNFAISSDKILSDEDKVKIFFRYLEEEKEYSARTCVNPKPLNFFMVDESCQFTASDSKLNLLATKKQLEKDIGAMIEHPDAWFNKGDITRLEYRYAGSYGVSDGLFDDVYAFEVRLNDEKEVSFKPSILRMAFPANGFTGGIRKKKAKEMCVSKLEELKRFIESDLPIVEVKKFD
jgi:hypothetical protein